MDNSKKLYENLFAVAITTHCLLDNRGKDAHH